MVMDYQLQNPTRRCSTTGRDLRPGDQYFGAVIDQGNRLARQDFAPEAWIGPPPSTIGHWAGRVPVDEVPRRATIDDEQLLGCYRRLEDAASAERFNLRYVLALLLIRRKRLRLANTKCDELGEVLVLVDPKTQTQSEVRNPRLSAADLSAVQREVFELLGWEA
jgi:hypothetical protein